MKKNIYILIILNFILLCGLSSKKADLKTEKIFKTKFDSLNLFDNSRNRSIPVALYLPKSDKKIENQKLVIISHGYFANRGGANKEYSYLAEFLASKGNFVASIQHELPSDDLIPEGNPQIVRRPFWERGVKNILFAINELKKNYPELDYKHLILIGHSNGGDMSMLFGQQNPTLVDKIISLDNRRVAFPRTKQPKIYSLRSSDQLADEGVLPTSEEQNIYGIRIIQLKNTTHSNMDNSGTDQQKKEINNYIQSFLND